MGHIKRRTPQYGGVLQAMDSEFCRKDKNFQSEDQLNQISASNIQSPTDIVFENNTLKMIVEKGAFKKQKNFRLQDHLFKFKIISKKPEESLPILTDLFEFLHAALVHIMESIKSFYKPEDHNIAYLTLHQEPMVNGLNTGFI